MGFDESFAYFLYYASLSHLCVVIIARFWMNFLTDFCRACEDN